jgi:SAM-dependent methyltransferase
MRVILISGPSGAGKTYAARAIGKQLGIPVVSTDLALIEISKYLAIDIQALGLNNNKSVITHPEFITEVDKWWNRTATSDFVLEGCMLCDNSIFYSYLNKIAEERGIELNRLYILPRYEVWSNQYVADSAKRQSSLRTYAGSLAHVSYHTAGWDVVTPDQAVIPYHQYQGRVVDTDRKWALLGLGDEVKGHSVLDLCCNEGDYTCLSWSSGATKVLGLDHNWQAIREARIRYPGFDYRVFDCNQVDQVPGEWDYVYLFAALHYFRDIDGILARIAKKANHCFVFEGVVHPSDTSNEHMHYRGTPYHDFIPTRPLLEKLLLRAGFKRIEYGGLSIPPGDRSHRIILKAYK